MISRAAAIVAACSLLIAAIAWIMRARVKARLRELEARDLAAAYEREVTDAAERKRQAAEQAAKDAIARVPEMSDAALEREINR